MAKKAKQKPITTPAGIASYPYLNQPDTFKNANVFKTKLILDAEDAEEFNEKLQAIFDAAQAEYLATDAGKKAKKNVVVRPFLSPEEDDNGDETGRFYFTAKSKFKPGIVDAHRQPCDVAIWGGSVLKLAVRPNHYAMTQKDPTTNKDIVVCGLSLQLVAVQVIELRNGGGGDASGLFEEEEGYEFDESDTPADNGGDTPSADEDSDEEF